MTTWSRHLGRWATAIVWLTLPLAAGPSFGDALASHSEGVRVVGAVLLWVAWAGGLVASLVPSTVSLTAVRVLAPAAVAAAAWAAAAVPDGADAPEAVALGVTALATVVALSAVVGDRFVNGSSYGDERRMPLRPPGLLLLGPVEGTWAVVVAGAVTGPLLLAAEVWVVGVVVLVVGWAAAAVGVRILHGLAQRWLVFVPAGVVLVDRMALTDALLVQRQRVDSLGPAPADSTAVDLTGGAVGLALELRLSRPETIVPAPRRPGRAGAEVVPIEVDAVLIAPSRPGWVLDEARARRLLVS